MPEPVEQLLVAAAALAVVQRHADNGKNAEPLIVDCEHLEKAKSGKPGTLQIDQHKITQEGQWLPRRTAADAYDCTGAYSTRCPRPEKDQPPSVMDVHKGSGAVMTHANTAETIGAS